MAACLTCLKGIMNGTISTLVLKLILISEQWPTMLSLMLRLGKYNWTLALEKEKLYLIDGSTSNVGL